jgi:hypothetical protein
MVGLVYVAGQSTQSECAGQWICVPVGQILLANLAMVPVIVIDAVFLARTTRREEAWKRLPPVQPSIARTPDGKTWLGLSGRF